MAAGRVTAALIQAVWDRLLRLPSRFFGEFSSGDLALRAMGLSEVFKKASTAVVTTCVTGVFSLLNLALLTVYSWRLALCAGLLLRWRSGLRDGHSSGQQRGGDQKLLHSRAPYYTDRCRQTAPGRRPPGLLKEISCR